MKSPSLVEESEANFQFKIIQLARLGGWDLVHAEKPALNPKGQWRTPIQGDPGFPDLVLNHSEKHKLLWVEVKIPGNNLEAEQYFWGLALLEAGEDYRVWFPHDWDEIITTFGVEVI